MTLMSRDDVIMQISKQIYNLLKNPFIWCIARSSAIKDKNHPTLTSNYDVIMGILGSMTSSIERSSKTDPTCKVSENPSEPFLRLPVLPEMLLQQIFSPTAEPIHARTQDKCLRNFYLKFHFIQFKTKDFFYCMRWKDNTIRWRQTITLPQRL